MKENESLSKTEIENLIPFYFLSFSCNPNARTNIEDLQKSAYVYLELWKLKIQRCQFLAIVLTIVPNPLQATESVKVLAHMAFGYTM